jgi:hypothetical protein
MSEPQPAWQAALDAHLAHLADAVGSLRPSRPPADLTRVDHSDWERLYAHLEEDW